MASDELDRAVSLGLVVNGAVQELHTMAVESRDLATRQAERVAKIRELWRQTPLDVRRTYTPDYGARIREAYAAYRKQAAQEQRELEAFEKDPGKWLTTELVLLPVSGLDAPAHVAAEHGSHVKLVGLAVAQA